jgi:SAM-dependent methyltransferase
MFTTLQYHILKRFAPSGQESVAVSDLESKSKLTTLLGEEIFERIRGKFVIDFGCGFGSEAVEMARRGADHVVGIDIREEVLQKARIRAKGAGVQDRCQFATATSETADLVISLDAFEHFANPAAILEQMAQLLRPGGEVIVSFGPTWYHPLGGHLFSVFPWAHLIFSEKALLRWRATFKQDGATRFAEVSGGLNQMTIARFENLIAASPLVVSSMELVPIKKLRPIHNRFTREFTTAIVRCQLHRRGTPS